MSGGLQVRGLVVAPGGADPVLGQVDLELEAGTRAALVGPSGAGKTTLLRAIAGLTSIRSGEIMVGGTDQAGIPAHDRRIAMVFQEPRLLPNLSALENVALPMRAAGSGKQERRATATERLTEVGLGGFGEQRIGGLSGGEQQRVALARALCADPELLLLDEPLAALDPNRRESLRRLLVEVQEARGLTSLLVTHDRSEAAELGQSIALMLDGRIVGHDSPEAMFERPRSVAAARFFGIANILELDRDPSGARWSIRPERVVLGSGSSRARVVEAVYRGTEVRLVMEWDGQRVEAAVAPDEAPAVGVEVAFELPSEHLWRLPDEGPGMEE